MEKKQINQSVIEGTITNGAAYSNIVFEVSYTEPDGTAVSVDIALAGTVYPGKHYLIESASWIYFLIHNLSL